MIVPETIKVDTFRRNIFFAIVALLALWMLLPVLSINRDSAARIKVGMTKSQAVHAIGIEPRQYDGITRFQSPIHTGKYWEHIEWVGLRGQIIALIDGGGNVTEVYFGPIKMESIDPISYILERITFTRFYDFNIYELAGRFLLICFVSTLAISLVFLKNTVRNTAANNGLVGLVASTVVGVCMFSVGFFDDMVFTAFLLFSPIAGSIIGMLVYGWTRGIAGLQPRTRGF